MATYEEDFEVAPDNTTLTTGNTIAFSYAGTAMVSDDAFAAVGTYSALAATASSTTSQVRFDQTEVDGSYLRWYFRMDALPAANLAICSLHTAAGGTIGDIRITTTGTLQIRNETLTLQDTSTTVLAADTWNRIEIHITNSAISGRIFKSPNEHGDTADEGEGSWTGVVSNTGHGRTIYGINTASINTLWFDAVAYDSADWIGTAVSSVTPPSLYQVVSPGRW